jgi:NAD dependent epimerase/dehydratase family enzyme
MAVPNRQSQKELIKEIKSCVFPFAIIFPIPIFFMKLFLGGRSQVLSGGLYLKSDKILNSGFNFTYPSVTSFLKNNKISNVYSK